MNETALKCTTYYTYYYYCLHICFCVCARKAEWLRRTDTPQMGNADTVGEMKFNLSEFVQSHRRRVCSKLAF